MSSSQPRGSEGSRAVGDHWSHDFGFKVCLSIWYEIDGRAGLCVGCKPMGILILPGGALSGRPLVCFLGLFWAVFFPVFSWVFLPGLFCFVFVLFFPPSGVWGLAQV